MPPAVASSPGQRGQQNARRGDRNGNCRQRRGLGLSKRYPVTVYDRELRPGTFNPLSVYFCYRADGELALMIYEVRNTFGDIHAYVLAVKPGEFAKPACGNSRTSCFTFRPSSICRCAIISGSRRRRPTSSSESWRPTARAPARRDLPWPPPRLERGAAATVVLCAAAGHAENRGGDPLGSAAALDQGRAPGAAQHSRNRTYRPQHRL